MERAVETITIENAPKIPGLAFRGFAGKEDFTHMADIINSANQADEVDDFVLAENIETNYKHLQRSDTDSDMLFVEIDGWPVGYGRCMWDEEQNGDRLYSFFLHMGSAGRLPGLCEAIYGHFMQRLQEIAAKHPAEAPKYFQCWANSDQEYYTKALEKLGFEIVRYGMDMVRPCSQPMEVTSMPEGIEVRPPTPEEYRKVFDAEAEAFRDHWGYVAPTEEDYLAFLDFPYFDPSIWKVAWDGDQVVGMVRNYIDHEANEALDIKRGWTENISVRRPWRRQGVARGLLTRSIKMFQEMGMEETALGVDTENPNGAKQLYEGVGYVERKRDMVYRKPLD